MRTSILARFVAAAWLVAGCSSPSTEDLFPPGSAGGAAGAGTGGSAGSSTGGTTGACAAPDCTGCTGCFDTCVCGGGDPSGCVTACAGGTGGSGGSTGGAGGSGAVGATGGAAGASGGAAGASGGAAGATGGAAGASGGAAGVGGTTGGAGGTTGGTGGTAGTGGTGGITGGTGGTTGGTGGTTGGTGGTGGSGANTSASIDCGVTSPQTCATGSACCYLDPGIDYCVQPGGSCACPSGANCDLVTPMFCDGPEDCPGAICCGVFDTQAQRYSVVECRTTCDLQQSQLQICRSDADCDTAGTSCGQSQTLPGYVLRCAP